MKNKRTALFSILRHLELIYRGEEGLSTSLSPSHFSVNELRNEIRRNAASNLWKCVSLFIPSVRCLFTRYLEPKSAQNSLLDPEPGRNCLLEPEPISGSSFQLFPPLPVGPWPFNSRTTPPLAFRLKVTRVVARTGTIRNCLPELSSSCWFLVYCRSAGRCRTQNAFIIRPKCFSDCRAGWSWTKESWKAARVSWFRKSSGHKVWCLMASFIRSPAAFDIDCNSVL